MSEYTYTTETQPDRGSVTINLPGFSVSVAIRSDYDVSREVGIALAEALIAAYRHVPRDNLAIAVLVEELLDGNGYSSDSAICSHVQSMFLAAGEIIRAYDSEDAKQRDGDA